MIETQAPPATNGEVAILPSPELNPVSPSDINISNVLDKLSRQVGSLVVDVAVRDEHIALLEQGIKARDQLIAQLQEQNK